MVKWIANNLPAVALVALLLTGVSKGADIRSIRMHEHVSASALHSFSRFTQRQIRPMTIFLDNYERSGTSFGVSGKAQQALVACASPVLVSAYVLSTIFINIKKEFSMKYFPLLDVWNIYLVNKDLFLLLPKAYHGLDQSVQTVSPQKFTDRELTVGLQIDHIEKHTKEQFKKYLEAYDKKLVPFADYFVSALIGQRIFVPLAAYDEASYDAYPIPQWFFFLSGHGAMGYSVAHLSIKQYQDILHFFNKEIDTKALIERQVNHQLNW